MYAVAAAKLRVASGGKRRSRTGIGDPAKWWSCASTFTPCFQGPESKEHSYDEPTTLLSDSEDPDRVGKAGWSGCVEAASM